LKAGHAYNEAVNGISPGPNIHPSDSVMINLHRTAYLCRARDYYLKIVVSRSARSSALNALRGLLVPPGAGNFVLKPEGVFDLTSTTSLEASAADGLAAACVMLGDMHHAYTGSEHALALELTRWQASGDDSADMADQLLFKLWRYAAVADRVGKPAEALAALDALIPLAKSLISSGFTSRVSLSQVNVLLCHLVRLALVAANHTSKLVSESSSTLV
jgi:hypothetical protein